MDIRLGEDDDGWGVSSQGSKTSDSSAGGGELKATGYNRSSRSSLSYSSSTRCSDTEPGDERDQKERDRRDVQELLLQARQAGYPPLQHGEELSPSHSAARRAVAMMEQQGAPMENIHGEGDGGSTNQTRRKQIVFYSIPSKKTAEQRQKEWFAVEKERSLLKTISDCQINAAFLIVFVGSFYGIYAWYVGSITPSSFPELRVEFPLSITLGTTAGASAFGMASVHDILGRPIIPEKED